MVKEIALSDIVDNPFQARHDFDRGALQSFADEIKAEGTWKFVLLGRKNGKGKVEIAFGHRRVRALRLLKSPTVMVDITSLTDAEMARIGLEENLQREGLTDLEKADAVRLAVELERKARINVGKPEQGAIQVVADRLGLAQTWVSKLCEISRGMPLKVREVVEAKTMTAQTAFEAKQWGGDDYVRTLARQSKEAEKETSTISKPTHMTVKAMKRAVAAAPERVQEQLREEVFSGKLERPDEVATRARRLESSKVRRDKEPPPDLKIVIVGMTHDLKEFRKKLETVAPYMDYVDEVPPIAERFREALRDLIETAKDILKASQ